MTPHLPTIVAVDFCKGLLEGRTHALEAQLVCLVMGGALEFWAAVVDGPVEHGGQVRTFARFNLSRLNGAVAMPLPSGCLCVGFRGGRALKGDAAWQPS
ncbi:hypothetical protein [Xylella fastidiosa]|uniref:hypothetical protein n=1 Tax=Xylella fastidiosa TaxID=2371 RepID=UPI003AFA070B